MSLRYHVCKKPIWKYAEFVRITQGKAEEKQRNDTERRKWEGSVRRCQRLMAHYRENQKKQGVMQPSCILLCCESTHNNHLAGAHVQIWKRKPNVVTLLTLLSLLHLAYSWPVVSLADLSVFGRDYLTPSCETLPGIATKPPKHWLLGIWEPRGNEDST